MRKRIIAIITSLAMIFNVCVFQVDVFAYSSNEITQVAINELSENATKYLEKNKADIEDIIKSCRNEMGIESMGSNIEFEDPFLIYDVDSSKQNEVYYYPIRWENGNDIIAVLSLMGTTVGWQYSIDTNWVDVLNNIDYGTKSYIFYCDDDCLTAQNEDEKKVLRGYSVNDEFDDKDIVAKRRIMMSQFNKLRKINTEENKRKSEQIPLRYSPTVTSELGYYYCNISGAQGQGYYGLCWAASSATIINYIKGTSYTAKNIADTMGIGYDAGAYIEDMAEAISKYGVPKYYATSTVPSFSSIEKYIQNKNPLIVSGYTSDGKKGHAVTLYGYRDLANGDYVMLWNSSMNNGRGGVSVTTYKGSGTTYAVDAYTFTWSSSVVGSQGISYK